MPNWCYNQIRFNGSETNEKKVLELFTQLQAKELQEQCGQKPDFTTSDDYFFNINIEDDLIIFETRWSPKIELCVEIAKHFDLNFEYTYEECGNQIFGKAIFTAGNEEAEELDLDSDDFDLYEYDEDNDSYIYNGETYESDTELQMLIWEKKFDTSY